MSKRTRKQIAGVVSRRLASDLKCMNLFGKEIVSMKFCPCCKTQKNKSEYYLEHETRSKHANQVRRICSECWDKTNGKMKEELPVGNTLLEFI